MTCCVFMQDNLRSTKQLLEVQEHDLRRLRIERDEHKTECKLLVKEVAVLEHEVAVLRQDNSGKRAKSKRVSTGYSPRKSIVSKR